MISPLFSIIIPTLNEEQYLPILLDDLAQQSFTNFEVIVIDGGSHDTTQQAADSFTDRLFLSFIQSSRKGISAQRNQGAYRANAPFLVFLDADTRVPDYFLEKTAREVQTHNYLIYLPELTPQGGAFIDKFLFRVSLSCVKLSHKLAKPLPIAGAMVFQKDFFIFLGGFIATSKTYFPEDHEILLRARKGGVCAKFLDDTPAFFSLRRLEKEGRIEFYRKYLISALHMTLKGNIDDNIFEYEMGGHAFKKQDEKKGQHPSSSRKHKPPLSDLV